MPGNRLSLLNTANEYNLSAADTILENNSLLMLWYCHISFFCCSYYSSSYYLDDSFPAIERDMYDVPSEQNSVRARESVDKLVHSVDFNVYSL
jgi:hypothetical protein